MEQAKQIANYLHGIGNEEDADYVMFMADSIENDELHITRLVKERDELAAQVERLRDAVNVSGVYKTSQEVCDALIATRPQSLAAVRAEAVEAVGSEILEFGHLAKNQNEIVGIKMAAQICEINAQRIRNGEA